MKPHFGHWLKKFRTRLGVSQSDFANLLGLESGAAIYQSEKKPTRRLRAATVEALLEVMGLMWERDLDALWQSWQLPDMEGIRPRVAAKLGVPLDDLRAKEESTAPSPLAQLEALAERLDVSAQQVVAHFQRLIPAESKITRDVQDIKQVRKRLKNGP